MSNITEIATFITMLYGAGFVKRGWEKIRGCDFTVSKGEVITFLFLGGIEGFFASLAFAGLVVNAAMLCWKHGVEDETRKLNQN